MLGDSHSSCPLTDSSSSWVSSLAVSGKPWAHCTWPQQSVSEHWAVHTDIIPWGHDYTLSHTSTTQDWIEQCFTSLPTQYRLYGRRFLQVKTPNQQYQSTEGKSTKYKL